MLVAVLRITAAAAVGAAAGLLAWYLLDALLGRSFGAQVLSVGSGLAAAGLAYWTAARAFRVRELDTLLLLRARRPESPE
jgi:hypothetical protein